MSALRVQIVQLRNLVPCNSADKPILSSVKISVGNAHKEQICQINQHSFDYSANRNTEHLAKHTVDFSGIDDLSQNLELQFVINGSDISCVRIPLDKFLQDEVMDMWMPITCSAASGEVLISLKPSGKAFKTDTAEELLLQLKDGEYIYTVKRIFENLKSKGEEWKTDFICSGGVKALCKALARSNKHYESSYMKFKQTDEDSEFQVLIVECLEILLNHQIGMVSFLEDKCGGNSLILLLGGVKLVDTRIKVLNMLSAAACCSKQGVSLVFNALNHYKTAKREKIRFYDLIESLSSEPRQDFKVAVFTLLNVLLSSNNVGTGTRSIVQSELAQLNIVGLIEELKMQVDLSESLAKQIQNFEQLITESYLSTLSESEKAHQQLYLRLGSTPHYSSLVNILHQLVKVANRDEPEDIKHKNWKSLETIVQKAVEGLVVKPKEQEQPVEKKQPQVVQESTAKSNASVSTNDSTLVPKTVSHANNSNTTVNKTAKEEVKQEPNIQLTVTSPSGNMGVPPPPPPPGSTNSALQEVFKIPNVTPTIPTKKLNMNSINRAALAKSVFVRNNVINLTNELAPHIQFDDLQAQFARDANKASTEIRKADQHQPSTTTTTTTSVSPKTSILEEKRAFHISILLASIRKSFKEITDAILHMDEETLTEENVIALCDAIPDNDTIAAIMKAPDVSQLTEPEKFIRHVGVIPIIRQRLAAWRFKLSFQTFLAQLDKDIVVTLGASQQLQSCSKFAQILALILLTGNFLNGYNRATRPSYGFKIDTLLKLNDTHSSDHKTTLLVYLVNLIHQKFPEWLHFYTELSNVPLAAKVTNIPERYQNCQTCLVNVQMQVNSYRKRKLDADDKFLVVMEQFYNFAKAKLESININLNAMNRSLGEVAALFDEAGVVNTPCQFFAILDEFCLLFKNAESQIMTKVHKREKLSEKIKTKREQDKTRLFELIRDESLINKSVSEYLQTNGGTAVLDKLLSLAQSEKLFQNHQL